MGVVPLFQPSKNKVMHPVHSFGGASSWCCRTAAGKLPQGADWRQRPMSLMPPHPPQAVEQSGGMPQ